MKTMKKLLFALVAVPFLLASCNGGNEPVVTSIKLETNTVTLNVDQTQKVKITVGSGSYNTPSSTNTAVATAVVEKDKTDGAYYVIVTAKTPGNATITVSEKDGAAATIAVKVNGVTSGDLTAAATFTLGRAASTGNPLSAYGITWSNTSTGNICDFTVPNVAITSAQYDATTTTTELAALVAGKTYETKFQVDANDGKFVTSHYVIKDGETLRIIKNVSIVFAKDRNVATFTERH